MNLPTAKVLVVHIPHIPVSRTSLLHAEVSEFRCFHVRRREDAGHRREGGRQICRAELHARPHLIDERTIQINIGSDGDDTNEGEGGGKSSSTADHAQCSYYKSIYRARLSKRRAGRGRQGLTLPCIIGTDFETWELEYCGAINSH